jgi:hypothetical protein
MKLTDLNPGDRIKTDGGFTCLPEGSIRIVRCDNGHLFIKCREGGHYLAGQIGDDDELIGIMPAKTSI